MVFGSLANYFSMSHAHRKATLGNQVTQRLICGSLNVLMMFLYEVSVDFCAVWNSLRHPHEGVVTPVLRSPMVGLYSVIAMRTCGSEPVNPDNTGGCFAQGL